MLQATVSFLEDILNFLGSDGIVSTIAILKIVFIVTGIIALGLIIFFKWKAGVYSDRLTGWNWYYKNLKIIEKAKAEAKERELSEDEKEIVERDTA